jgi:hypothetical protein
VQKVIGLGQTTSQQGQNKENYPILDDFQEILEIFMFIYHGEMVAIFLQEFVVVPRASEHV